MKDIIPAKKQSPILGLTGMGGGVGSNIVAGLAKDTPYIDELFSSYLYNGDNSNQTITNGIDNTKGGLVWTKNRTNNWNNNLIDTVRGKTKRLNSDTNVAEAAYNDLITSFTNTGYTIGADTGTNQMNETGAEFVSWNFRKRKGFFDIVTWNGDSTAGRQISHELETIPGCIMVKRTNSSSNWVVYHRSTGNNAGSAGHGPEHVALTLNNTNSQDYSNEYWNHTLPTKDHFTLGIHPTVNQTGGEYVAYIFAHNGSSTTGQVTSHVKSPNGMVESPVTPPTMSTGPFGVANTAVTFAGTSTKSPLTAISGPQFCLASQNYTIECWFKAGSTAWSQSWSMLFSQWDVAGIYFGLKANGEAGIYNTFGSSYSGFNIGWTQDTWHHVAITREGTGSNQSHVWLDGVKKVSWHDSSNVVRNESHLAIGYQASGGSNEEFAGQISNLRYTVGQALYTSNFTPATSNLTLTSQGANEKNVVFLGLNGDANADYEEANKFGENEDQSIIKCGSYDGASNINVAIGFQPQLLFIKAYSSASNGNCDWLMIDTLRGLGAYNSSEAVLRANQYNNEGTYDNLHMSAAEKSIMDAPIQGFRGTGGYDNSSNSGNGPYLYIAIRKPDGLVSKPPTAGTDVFTVDDGNSSATQSFTSGFPVEYAIIKDKSSTSNWEAMGRLVQGRYMVPNTNVAEVSYGDAKFDDMTGCITNSGYDSTRFAWMWKTGHTFDAVCYTGNGVASMVQHNLGRAPEMVVIKDQDTANDWTVWFSSFDNETIIKWNGNGSLTGNSSYWNNRAPTATRFSVGTASETNAGGRHYLALLYASVTGISKIGNFTGNGQTGASGPFITTGFQPRFIIVKRAGTTGADSGFGWNMHDSLRGMDKRLALNTAGAESTNDAFTLSSTGFRVKTSNASYNASGANYVYYAHA